jgi:hypothetical protein
MDRIDGHVAFFDEMFELIPAKYYFNNATASGAVAANGGVNSKYARNKKDKAPKQAIKEASKRAKRAKLDPNQKKTNVERMAKGATYDEHSSGAEESTMTGLKQRLEARVDTLRKQRQATAHRKITNPSGSTSRRQNKKEKKAAESKSNRKRKREQPPTLASEESSRSDPGASDEIQYDFGSMIAGEGGKHKFKSKKKRSDKDLLKRAEGMRQKLQEADPETAKQIKQSAAWDAALGRATGEKVKDDPALLRKAIKQKARLKNKSKKQWAERLQEHDQRKADVKQREDKKKEWRLANKGKKKKGGKKGGNRPGFEGRTLAKTKMS